MKRLIRRLDSTRTKLLQLIGPLDEPTLNRRPSENEWSIAEIVNHLYLVEERVIKDLEKALAREPRRPGLMRRLVPTSIVASRLIRVKAPKAVDPIGKPETHGNIADLKQTRQQLKQLCETYGRERLSRTTFKHPFLGEITGVATVSFVGYHEQRHLKQMKEVLRRIGHRSH